MGLIIESSLIGQLYLNRNNIDSAKHYFLIAQAHIRDLKQYKHESESLLGLGEIFEKQNRTDSALVYYRRALKASIKAQRAGNVKISYKLLWELYDKLGDKKAAQDYAKKYAIITDSLMTDQIKASTVPSDFIIKENETKHSKTKNKYIFIILASVSFLIILVFSLIKLRKNYKKTVLSHKEEHLVLSKRLDNLQVDKLEEEVLKEIVNLIKSNDPSFFAKFKEHHPIFIEKIMRHSPDMLSSDLSVCAKLKLGFNTKEIAYYDRSSQRAVESRKYRIRKKLGLTADDDLATWVVNL